ncbi:MAG: hypothetical protein ACP5H2_06560 [Solirubrobacteraceae bacterium]
MNDQAIRVCCPADAVAYGAPSLYSRQGLQELAALGALAGQIIDVQADRVVPDPVEVLI